MAPITEKISALVNLLPLGEQTLVFEIVKRFVPDDMATPEDLAAIKAAREEYKRGETLDLSDIAKVIAWDTVESNEPSERTA
ncbi:hypothetical protein FACS18949_18190 [Clostridia bacterium]|nr:hypothetical protein FACS189425_08190 [Clostridia bacterium]GHV37895.1 hypothetical protein FACS18949_18190 [Clostridia bacterium]